MVSAFKIFPHKRSRNPAVFPFIYRHTCYVILCLKSCRDITHKDKLRLFWELFKYWRRNGIVTRNGNDRIRSLHTDSFQLRNLKIRVKMRIRYRNYRNPEFFQCFPYSVFMQRLPCRAAIMKRNSNLKVSLSDFFLFFLCKCYVIRRKRFFSKRPASDHLRWFTDKQLRRNPNPSKAAFALFYLIRYFQNRCLRHPFYILLNCRKRRGKQLAPLFISKSHHGYIFRTT